MPDVTRQKVGIVPLRTFPTHVQVKQKTVVKPSAPKQELFLRCGKVNSTSYALNSFAW